MTNRKALKIINEYLERVNDPYFQVCRKYHQKRIAALEWLKAYYEGRAGCTPKELLSSILIKNNFMEWEYVQLLYFWVHEKRIVGF